jgi:hypothetical protein
MAKVMHVKRNGKQKTIFLRLLIMRGDGDAGGTGHPGGTGGDWTNWMDLTSWTSWRDWMGMERCL